ncbi:MAG: hypothetical protein HYS25_08840 [Ignavibacteriales bacterium]|nr:hypothetical protein [Ignavibacteriales bacterium]
MGTTQIKPKLNALIAKIKSLEKNTLEHWFLFDENKIMGNDIDIVLKVSDETDVVLLTKKIIPLLIEFMKENNIFIACFPINECEFNVGSKNSQFIKNVENYGKK